MWLAEAIHAMDNTMCLTLLDFYLRRVPLFLAEKDHGQQHLSALAKVFAEYYQWGEAKTSQELQGVQEYCQRALSWKTFNGTT